MTMPLPPVASSAEPIKQPDTKNARDPHQFPAFNNQLAFHEPLLYLPPLLSSLPKQYTEADVGIDPQLPRVVTETRLPDIDPASLSLHKVLHAFRPVTLGYATVPYDEAFNWSELKLPLHEEREWYCVVFRSKRKPGSDDIRMFFQSWSMHSLSEVS